MLSEARPERKGSKEKQRETGRARGREGGGVRVLKDLREDRQHAKSTAKLVYDGSPSAPDLPTPPTS